MKLRTEREEIRKVANRWNSQYAGSHWRKDAEKNEIGRRLNAMDAETATADDVAAIIGNDSWIDVRCDECGTRKQTLVHFGDEPDYEANWQFLCGDCLTAGLKLLGGAT
jgi:hypothetical protein